MYCKSLTSRKYVVTILEKGIVLKKLMLLPLLLTSLTASELVQTDTTLSVNECTNTIVKKIEAKKGFGVFAIIDHQKNAKKVGMSLAPQRVIIFGNPKAGTLLMQNDAQIGYDLPLRIMVREKSGKIVVEYRNPIDFASNYHLGNSPLPKKMAKLLNGLAKSCR